MVIPAPSCTYETASVVVGKQAWPGAHFEVRGGAAISGGTLVVVAVGDRLRSASCMKRGHAVEGPYCAELLAVMADEGEVR